MRSATSYFNGTLYHKTLARFWPLWAGYGVLWMFLIPLSFLSTYFDRYMSTEPVRRLLESARCLPSYLSSGVFIALFAAILCAMAVYGYLYNSRSACWSHALPMRREALFTTQYLAGLSMMLLPLVAVAVLTAAIEVAFLPMEHWGTVLSALLLWLAVQSALCLFFFSFAAFCAMFTGHILALPAFYCILNILADVIYTLLDGLFREFFFGYAGSADAASVVEYLTPANALRNAADWWDEDGLQSPGTVAVYALVGVALAAASLYVYRRRHVETAGDVVAIPLVRPLFKYGVAFCAGLCLGMFTTMFFGWGSTISALIPCVVVWTVIGCFAAEMLLKKSFRVFRYWKGAAVMAGVMLVLCLGCSMDVLGVSARVPALDQVERLDVSMEMGYPSDDGDSLSVTLTQPENIQRFLELHRAIVADRDRMDYDSDRYAPGDDYTRVRLWYSLKGGRSLDREYNSITLFLDEADQEGTVTQLLQSIAEDRELVARAYDFDGFLKDYRLTGAGLYGLKLEDGSGEIDDTVYVDDYAQELWDAVQADFAEGTIGKRYLFDASEERNSGTYFTDLRFQATSALPQDRERDFPSASKSLTITLTPNARHTLAVLDKTGIWEEGYSLEPWDTDYDPRYPDTAAGNEWEIAY